MSKYTNFSLSCFLIVLFRLLITNLFASENSTIHTVYAKSKEHKTDYIKFIPVLYSWKQMTKFMANHNITDSMKSSK